LLAHFSNLLSIVLGEQVQFEDTLSNIWRTHNIDFENFSL
jgi:hypothetical protein